MWEKERISLIERYSTTKSFYDPSGGDIESLHEELKNKNILIQQLESQVKSLGQQLLRKQDAMQELLSERAALKVRLQDSQRRFIFLNTFLIIFFPLDMKELRNNLLQL